MSSKNRNIRIVSLANQCNDSELISHELEGVLKSTLSANKKTLLFYNRRAHSHAWICKDCGYFESCPDCDIALAYHSQPTPSLRCHQCTRIMPIPEKCPRCGSHFSHPIGVGIQQLESKLIQLFPEKTVLRIDSDMSEKSSSIQDMIETSDIILSTQKGSMIRHADIGCVAFVLFEVNMSVPVYDIEEEVYDTIAYFKKQHIPLYIQSFILSHPVLQSIASKNHHDFLNEILIPERKSFGYPPFGEFVIIRVHHHKKERVSSIVDTLSQVITPLVTGDIFFSADCDMWTRSKGQWNQKIVLKGRGVIDIIEILTPYIIRNRSAHLEWQ